MSENEQQEATVVTDDRRSSARDDQKFLSEKFKHLPVVEYKLPQEDVGLLKTGSVLWKVRSYNKWYRRRYVLDPDRQVIAYDGSHKFPCFSDPEMFIDIKDIHDVRRGWKTDTFNKLGTRVQKQSKRHPDVRPLVDEHCCFSVIYDQPHRTLDLVAPNERTCEAWVNGLQQVVAQNKSMEYKENYQLWLKKQFNKADKDSNSCLNFSECVDLLRQLNIEMNDKHAMDLFQKANINKKKVKDEDALDCDEFIIFYSSLLNRPELQQLIRRFGIHNTEILGPQELCAFALQEQKMENITIQDCEAIIKGYEAQNPNKSADSHLSLGGFRLFLLSDKQNIFNFEHRQVYQDMSRPLCHYFIASSHNTYLIADQLSGESSVEGYVNALKRGCRCVEMDLWDGDDGEPIIYHGYTLTSKILFKEVISDAIKPYAFAASEYPLILSFENHCGVEQQKKVAAHLKTILGDMLYTTPVSADMNELPSPQFLKKKIILKAKKLKDEQETDVGADSDTEDEADGQVNEKGKKKVESLSKELSDLVVLCRSVHFKSFDYNRDHGQYYDIVSLAEKKTLNLIEDLGDSFVDHTRRQLVRIYPGGTRTGSSNYNPIPMWNVGSQIVALNYQTEDKPNLFNTAKFQDNGNCGYVLKPDLLLEGKFNPNDPLDNKYTKVLHIKVISGQHLPKPGQKMKAGGDVVDPYVKIKVRGHAEDKQKYTTKHISNNGFNPIWDETTVMRVKMPALAFLQFVVFDYSATGTDEKLGQCIIPFGSIQQGYRHVTLVDERGHPVVPATLFVHVVISDN